MSETLPSYPVVQAAPRELVPSRWEPAPLPLPVSPKRPLERPISALRRYKWLALGVLVLCIGAGFAATRFVTPEYEVNATIWINSETPSADRAGPIRSQELLNSSAWVELLKSFRIADAVVRNLSLFVSPLNPRDRSILEGFQIADKFEPGEYQLTMDPVRQRWSLANAAKITIDSGSATDSVGRAIGFKWAIRPGEFLGSQERQVRFVVSTPREVAGKLVARLDARLPEHSNFLWLKLVDPNPMVAQQTLNSWAHEYVAVAGELKKRNVVLFATTLDGQLRFAESSLHDAEKALEDFRVNTITLPAEGGPVAAGVELTRDPALRSFFDQKVKYDDARNDREALERIISSANAGSIPWETILQVPSVAQSPGADALRDALKDLRSKRAELSVKRQTYTDQHQEVRDVVSAIDVLQRQTVPQLASQSLLQLREREGDYDRRVITQSRELRAIPTRTIEEMRLRRAVSVSEGLYTTLKSRYSEARLAEASATPDVSVLDSAIAPTAPTKRTAPKILLVAVLVGLGAAVGLAMLLDALDGRIRYPEQVTNELGLAIAGAIPLFPKGGPSAKSPEQMSQLVESIRTIRMHIRQTAQAPLSIAISSPSPGDGKSFVSANLAMSFADAGFRTMLVDADTRRGKLNELFSLPMTDGLTDYLKGRTDLETAIRPTSHDMLWMIPCGRRPVGSPELLTSAGLPELADELRRRYDVVVFDTPPLAAGIDAYAIASAAKNLAIVVRIGKTNRRLAANKIALVDRLPVRVIGGVINGVSFSSEFDSYGYAYGYGVYSEETAVTKV